MLERCDAGGAWLVAETCQFGCSANACQLPPLSADDTTIVAVTVFGVLLVLVVSYRKRIGSALKRVRPASNQEPQKYELPKERTSWHTLESKYKGVAVAQTEEKKVTWNDLAKTYEKKRKEEKE